MSYSMDLKATGELRIPLNKAVPGKFNGFDKHNKRNCLQDRTNFTGLGGELS